MSLIDQLKYKEQSPSIVEEKSAISDVTEIIGIVVQCLGMEEAALRRNMCWKRICDRGKQNSICVSRRLANNPTLLSVEMSTELYRSWAAIFSGVVSLP
jgi:hypothetical protein